jgi:2-polyprenyl-6-methoxyphenol hydroxylase-like FAD-dependent oxidoreductase
MSSSVSMDTENVVIVGAGPVGLMLAAELCLAGVRPVVLERLPERSPVPKANGLVGQVVRVLDHRGLYQRFTGVTTPPRPVPGYMFGGLPLPLGDWANNPMSVLPLPQWDLEKGLQDRVAELGGRIRRGHEVTALDQDEHGVTIQVTGPDGEHALRARYLVGCDGGHSVVRKLAGIGFPGVSNDRVTSFTAHVVLPAELLTGGGELALPGRESLRPFVFHRTPGGVFVFAAFQPGVHLVNVMEWDLPPVDDDAPVALADIAAAAARVLGTDLPMTLPDAPGRYVLRRLPGRNSRQADRYRAGRVLVAGDAAHVHAGIGGPGLNLGLQDVVNLGWKLAAQVQGWAPAGLLDTYHDERHPVGSRVVMHSQVQSLLLSPGSDVTALRALFGELLTSQDTVHHVANLISGADIHYTSGDSAADPLVGTWVGDVPLTVDGRATRLAELTRSARPLLLDLTGDDTLADVAAGWADRVERVVARTPAPAPPFGAALIRPDGYLAWVAGSGSPDTALRTWFGEPADVPVRAGR